MSISALIVARWKEGYVQLCNENLCYDTRLQTTVEININSKDEGQDADVEFNNLVSTNSTKSML
jgi:hypothetical protein